LEPSEKPVQPTFAATVERKWAAMSERLGRRYADCRLANYRVETDEQKHALKILRWYAKNMKEQISIGRGIVLFGPVGTGKDHLLTAMVRAAIGYGMDVHWINGMEFFGRMRDSIGGDVAEEGIISKLVHPDILAISDPLPPSGELSPYQSSVLFRTIDARYRKMKPIFVTANFADAAEANKRLGASIIDRLKQDAVTINCNWKSDRKPFDVGEVA